MSEQNISLIPSLVRRRVESGSFLNHPRIDGTRRHRSWPGRGRRGVSTCLAEFRAFVERLRAAFPDIL